MPRLTLAFLFWAATAFALVPDTDELLRGLEARRAHVPEFRYLEAKARELGLKLWLFGGTAAAFTHYVRDHLRQEAGDSRYRDFTFNYDFTRVFRPTQDLDLVADDIDVNVTDQEHLARVQALERMVLSDERLVHFQGSKERWEIRSLRRRIGSKVPLLGNPDCLNQHTDSHSTGMILLGVFLGEPVLRDLKAWNDRKPPFLRDVVDSRGRFYFEPLHETTSRYLEGKNPPVIAALRFLTKVFQFELSVTPDDRKAVERIFRKFSPSEAAAGTYLNHWLRHNGPKLYQNAVDVEFARRELDAFAIREKLIKAGGDRNLEGTLAWWMEKEPLWSKPLVPCSGKTAAKWNLDVVTHETRSFEVYEAIIRSRKSTPNVFQSRGGNARNRKNYAGEMASAGDGFYTKRGEWGNGNGFPVRFRVRADAVEGRDFFVVAGDVFVFVNRAVLTVVPSRLEIQPGDFFRWLTAKDFDGWRDKGVLERMRRQVRSRSLDASDDEAAAALAAMLSALRSESYRSKAVLYESWFSFLSPSQQKASVSTFTAEDWERLAEASPSIALKAFQCVREEPPWLALGSQFRDRGLRVAAAAWLSVAGVGGVPALLGTADEALAFEVMLSKDVPENVRAALAKAYSVATTHNAVAKAFAMQAFSYRILHDYSAEVQTRQLQAWAASYPRPADALRAGLEDGFLRRWPAYRALAPETLGFEGVPANLEAAKQVGLTATECVFLAALTRNADAMHRTVRWALAAAQRPSDIATLGTAIFNFGFSPLPELAGILERLAELGAKPDDYRVFADSAPQHSDFFPHIVQIARAGAAAATDADSWLRLFAQPQYIGAWCTALGRELYAAYRRFENERPQFRQGLHALVAANVGYHLRGLDELLDRYDRLFADQLDWPLLAPLKEGVIFDFTDEPLEPVADAIFRRLTEVNEAAVFQLCYYDRRSPRSVEFRGRVVRRALAQAKSFAEVNAVWNAATFNGYDPIVDAFDVLSKRIADFPATIAQARHFMRSLVFFEPAAQTESLLSAVARAAYPRVGDAASYVALMKPVIEFHRSRGEITASPHTLVAKTLGDFERWTPTMAQMEAIADTLVGNHYRTGVFVQWLEHVLAGDDPVRRSTVWMKAHARWEENARQEWAAATFERFARLEPRPTLTALGRYLFYLKPEAQRSAIVSIADRLSAKERARLESWVAAGGMPWGCVRWIADVYSAVR